MARRPETRCRRRRVRSGPRERPHSWGRLGDHGSRRRERRSWSSGRGQAESAPSTPRPLSRVLLTPGRPESAPPRPRPRPQSGSQRQLLQPRRRRAPGAWDAAAAGTPRPLRAQLCSLRGVLRPARPCRGRPARYLQGARAAATSPSRARKLPPLWSPARSWARGGAVRAVPPAPCRAPSRAARCPRRPQLPTRAGAHSHSRLGPPPPRGHWLFLPSPSRCSQTLCRPLADEPVTSEHRALVGGESGAGSDRLGGRGGSDVVAAESGRGPGGKRRSLPSPARRATGAGPRGSSRATTGLCFPPVVCQPRAISWPVSRILNCP